jgi:hypothetical protein
MVNRTILKRFLIVAIALVALVAVAWGALAVFFPPSRVRQIVQTEITRSLEREVRFDDAGLTLFPPVRLTIKRPALAEPGGFEKGRAFEANSIHLDLDVFALLTRRIVVRRLILDEPRIHLVLRQDGTNNLEGIGKAAQPEGGAAAAPPAMEVAVQELASRGGGVLIDDLEAGRRTVFAVESNLGLLAAGGGQKFSTSGQTSISGLSFGPLSATQRSDMSTGLAAITWEIEHNGAFDAEQKRLALDPVTIRFGGAVIAFRGLVDDPGPKARMHLRTKGREIELGEVLKMLAVADAAALHGITGSGQLDFDLDVRGVMGAGRLPDVTGTLLLGEASFRYPDAPAAVEGLSFAARFAPDTLEIRSLTARVAGVNGGDMTPVRARLLVTNLEDPNVVFAVQGDVDLATVAPMLAPPETQLAGRANIDVRGRGPAKNPAAFDLEGRARFSKVSVESPDLPNRVEDIQGDIQFSRTHAKVTGLRARAGESSFKLDATVDGPLALLADPAAPGGEPVTPARIAFDLESPYLNMNELVPATPGTASALPNATGSGQVRIGRFRRDRLDVENVTARVNLTPQRISIPEFEFTGYQGKVAGNAGIDMRNPEKPVFDLNATATEVDANEMLSVWTPAKGLLQGTLNSDIELSGAGLSAGEILPTLTAVGLASIASGTLGPGPALEAIANLTQIPSFATIQIRDGKVPFAVERGRVRMREVKLAGGNGEWRLAGSVGFDGSLDYAVSVTLPRSMAQNLGSGAALAAGAFQDDEGRLLIDLRVTGPASSPKVSWDTAAMGERLRGKASRALAELGGQLGTEGARALQGDGGQDSTAAGIQARTKALTDSLKKVGVGDVIKSIFGKSDD